MKVEENIYFHGNYYHASVTKACMTSTVYKTTTWYQRFFLHKDRQFFSTGSIFSIGY